MSFFHLVADVAADGPAVIPRLQLDEGVFVRRSPPRAAAGNVAQQEVRCTGQRGPAASRAPAAEFEQHDGGGEALHLHHADAGSQLDLDAFQCGAISRTRSGDRVCGSPGRKQRHAGLSRLRSWPVPGRCRSPRRPSSIFPAGAARAVAAAIGDDEPSRSAAASTVSTSLRGTRGRSRLDGDRWGIWGGGR